MRRMKIWMECKEYKASESIECSESSDQITHIRFCTNRTLLKEWSAIHTRHSDYLQQTSIRESTSKRNTQRVFEKILCFVCIQNLLKSLFHSDYYYYYLFSFMSFDWNELWKIWTNIQTQKKCWEVRENSSTPNDLPMVNINLLICTQQ
jgi:hypothetical protein